MSSTKISDKVKNMLLVKSGGRCEYEGCNTSLVQDIVTKRDFNQAYIAHIVADEPGGPRGCPTRSPLLGNTLSNLMLLCDRHHRLIDKIDVPGHPEALLVEMKHKHEDRIERLTAIAPDMGSHIVIYRANVGVHTPMLTYESVREYLLPNHYPAQANAIDLGMTNSPQRDKDALFWQTEISSLEEHFRQQIGSRLRKNDIRHLSLFAFAPIPLLIKLGTLINDIQDVEVHQPVRATKTWNLSDDQSQEIYSMAKPAKKHPIVVLNISLSATITNERITAVLGENCSIYTLTIGTPFNDFLRNKIHLADFSIAVRKLLNEIKAVHGTGVQLHVFPAMPIATAIELGRVWMPKADLPMIIYDQNTATGGFSNALEIVNI